MTEQNDLSKESGRWMRVLSREEFQRMMSAAMESTLIEHGTLTPARARALGSDALRRFAGLMQRRARRVRGYSREDVLQELAESHDSLLQEHQRLTSEISQFENQVRAARKGIAASAFDAPQQAELEHALRADIEALVASGAPREALEALLGRERARHERALKAERDRVDLLERRLVKLRKALDDQEREIAELARRAEIDSGVSSIYREVQGLNANELEREAKAKLLRDIFEQNLALQHKG